MTVDREAVLAAYDDGVTSIENLVVDDWDAVVCGSWSATELAGHLVNVVSWYHNWLDLAEDGFSKAPWSLGYLDRMTEDSLAALPDGSGPDRLAEFVDAARGYRERLPASWDIAYGYPRGTVTAGGHAAVAATEWHLHAWDFTGGTHRPASPQPLAEATATVTLLARVPFRLQRLAAPLIGVAARREIDKRGGPWETLLHHAGR